MSLNKGQHLGPYEILAPIGAGGMGEVYRARDTRLDRIVAIKVLPSNSALSSSLKQRFEREAKTISALSHPHICALYDIGSQAEIDYLVMEYCDGETLATRLTRGPLPLDQVIRCAIQIADAVDKAHRQGVIHRDLKPGNIILTKNGAKLLDFGLAKLMTATAEEFDRDGVTALATKQEPLTEEGVVLGTFQYMAPEQLEGKPADARTDLFALGAVLYEMATGAKAFSGKSRASLIASILEHHPEPISRRQPTTPPALDHVVERCLEKDPENRWQSARDIVAELQWIEAAGSQAGVAAPVASRRRKREATAWTVAALLVLTVLATTVLWLRRGQKQAQTIRLTIPAVTPQYRMSPAWSGGSLRVSPDGKRVAFVAAPVEKDETILWVRSLDSFDAKPLEGTKGAVAPFWSPDSRLIGFFANDELKTVSADGGVIQSVAKIGSGFLGATWSANGWIVFAYGQTGIKKVSVSGGDLKTITKIDRSQNEHAHLFPHFLPDGEHFLFLGSIPETKGSRQNHRLYAGSLKSEETTFIAELPSLAEYVEPGLLLFVREGNLMAQRFDLKELRLSGEPKLVGGPVVYFRPTGGAAFSASGSGVIAFHLATESNRLVKVDDSGKILETIGDPGGFSQVRVSPKGGQAVVSVVDMRNGTGDLWLYGLDRRTKSRFTFEPGWEGTPVWAHDESAIYFAADWKGWPDIYRKDVGGSGEATDVLVTDGLQFPTDVSSNGRFLIYDHTGTTDSSGNSDIFILPLEKNAKPDALIQTPFNETGARFSPDGKWIAFSSNETEKSQIYIQPFPGPGQKTQISTDGGEMPRWSKVATRLFYKNRKELMAVQVDETIRSKAPRPIRVFESASEFNQFEVLGDREFLMSIVDEVQSRPPVHVILNWQDSLGP
ncbi:MAG: serine/threonine-protein kinase [Verrucomicrobia bacterium]|nr:serine/threonine-protein kinase [Verrucomicrobiota bacterium]